MAKRKKYASFKNKNLGMEKKSMKDKKEELNEMMSSEYEPQEETTKKRQSKLYYFVIILLLVVAAIYFGVQRYGNLIVVATVNGKPITRLSLWQRLEKQTGKQILDQMVSESLIEQEAATKKIIISDKEIDAKIKTLENQFKGKAGLDQVLSLQGMTMSDLRTQLKYNLIVERLVPEAKVSDQEIVDYYDKNQSSYGEELTDDVKSQIKNTLLQQKKSKAISDWFDGLKKKAKISSYL